MPCYKKGLVIRAITFDLIVRTQNALVANVSMLLLKPGFLPAGVTRLYTHSRSQTLVFMFQESSMILKFGASSIWRMLTLAAPSQSDWPLGLNPVNPRPVRMLEPLIKHEPRRLEVVENYILLSMSKWRNISYARRIRRFGRKRFYKTVSVLTRGQ